MLLLSHFCKSSNVLFLTRYADKLQTPHNGMMVLMVENDRYDLVSGASTIKVKGVGFYQVRLAHNLFNIVIFSFHASPYLHCIY